MPCSRRGTITNIEKAPKNNWPSVTVPSTSRNMRLPVSGSKCNMIQSSMKRKSNTSRIFVIVILTMLFWIPCSGQDKVLIDRDSLYNVLLNLAELKVEVRYLQKKSTNQKLIIQSQGIVIQETELKVDILKDEINGFKSKRFWAKLWAFLKGVAVGGAIVLLL